MQHHIYRTGGRPSEQRSPKVSVTHRQMSGSNSMAFQPPNRGAIRQDPAVHFHYCESVRVLAMLEYADLPAVL